MAQPSPADNSMVVSYLVLRRAVGVLGIALPFVVAIGKRILDGPGIQSTISAYYYTSSRNLFVGTLCAIASFLLSYRGYDRKDSILSNCAGALAIGIALFPTTPEIGATPTEKIVGCLHIFFAAGYFLLLAYFSLVLFTKTDGNPTRRKMQRNSVYRVCGYTILVCLALIVAVSRLPDGAVITEWKPRFWLESMAVVAFGVSWLTKGEAILPDQ
jgi:hypothetical protein